MSVAEARTVDDLSAYLAEIALQDPRSFADALVEALVKELDLFAASLYLQTPGTERLRLRAKHGISMAAWSNLELELSSTPGRAITQRRTIVETRHSEAISGEADGASGAIIATPLRLSAKEHFHSPALQYVPRQLGALCLFPRHQEDTDRLTRWADRYSSFLASLYVASLDRYAMDFRRATVDQVAFRSDIGSLAYTFLSLVKDELPVEAASLWTIDTRRNMLYLRRSTDLAVADHERDVTEVYFTEENIISRCLNERTTFLHSQQTPILNPDEIHERLDHPLHNAAIIPVALPERAKLRGREFPSAGVLVVLNHFVEMDGAWHLAAFTWEDRFLAEFACELISVLIYQMLRNQDHESDYERLIHGARTSLESARANLQTLENRQVDRYLEPEDGYLVPDAIDWIEDLESQINRDELVGRSDLEVGPVSLYGDVLAKIGPMVRRMRTRAHNPTFSLVGFERLAENYRDLPKVQGNPKALDCIFRNLIDNSMKYCRTDDGVHATVEISAVANRARGLVLITVADNGIGIDDDERDLIFESGFRGKRATGRATQGVGRGLFECRLLLKRMGGDIELGKGEHGATFTIMLPSVATGVIV